MSLDCTCHNVHTGACYDTTSHTTTCTYSEESCDDGAVWISARDAEDSYSLNCRACVYAPSAAPTSIPTITALPTILPTTSPTTSTLATVFASMTLSGVDASDVDDDEMDAIKSGLGG